MKHSTKLIFTILMLFVIVEVLSAQTKPNIVVILADDMGYGSANCYGAPKTLIRTPHMDQLASEGMRFTDASTPASLCSPTRYALLTGRYAWRGRLKSGVLYPPEGALLVEEDLFTLPDYLQQQGYNTAHIGKWHLGYTNQYNVEDLSAQPLVPGPRSIGFDYHFAVPNQIDWRPKVYVENEGIWGLRSKGTHPYGRGALDGGLPYHGYDAPQRVTTQVTVDLNQRAREWIFKSVRQEPEKPFFLYFAPIAVHNPITPGEELRGSSGCGPYGDYLHDLDHSVGEILDALAYSGVLDNTIVIFTSDNGGAIGQIEEQEARKAGLKNNGIFRGKKASIWEGGFRVPFLVRWPGHVKEGVVSDRMINVVDIFATVQEMISGEVLPPKEAGADSYSFYDELIGERNENSVRPHMVVNSGSGVVAIRKGPWKYIEGVPQREGAKKTDPELYNIENDISESEDRILEYPKIHEDLQSTLDKIRALGSERLDMNNELP